MSITEFNTNDLNDIAKAIDNAQYDDTPYLINEGDKDKPLMIVGDANKTEVKKNDYKITFMFPDGLLKDIPDNAKVLNDRVYLQQEFKDQFISPSKNLKMQSSVMKVQEFYFDLKKDGSIEKLSEKELFHRFADLSENFIDAVYNFVAMFLNIPEGLIQYMLVGSVIHAFMDIANNHPEVINESELF